MRIKVTFQTRDYDGKCEFTTDLCPVAATCFKVLNISAQPYLSLPDPEDHMLKLLTMCARFSAERFGLR